MSTDIVGSNFPDAAVMDSDGDDYGMNGFDGASSDQPGQRTKSGFLPDCDLDAARGASGLSADARERTPNGMPQKRAATKGGDVLGPQTRRVSAAVYPTTFGMRNRSGE